MNKKLVSIILPCYNAEPFINRYFDALLLQTFKNIELLCIDDGSTDQTRVIIQEYIPLFNAKGICCKYIFQENKGLPGAINTGLKLFTGDYLTWGDPDDYLSPTSIEERVQFLEKNTDYGFVRTDVRMFRDEHSIETLGVISSSNRKKIFDSLITETQIMLTPGCYLIRSSVFREALPSCHIYDKPRGQNWQLLLPVALISDCGYIAKDLNNYAVRQGSMSRDDDSSIDELNRCTEHEDILLNVVLGLDVDKEKYEYLIKGKYEQKRFEIACEYKEENEFLKYYNMISKKTLRVKILLLRTRYSYINTVVTKLTKLKRLFT